jgi:surface polysaccharide O-acyltransferase-like enzyme
MQRRYDIDWLRNLVILFLFPFHTARIFDVWEPFYVKNDAAGWGLSWFVALAGYWMMPLLFWLAGSASWYSLQRRSDKQVVKERFFRLFVPFLAGTLLVVPPQGYVARIMLGEEPGPYLVFLLNYFPDFRDLSGYSGSFSPAHLWFILYLFVFSLVALPLFRRLMQHQDGVLVRHAARLLSRWPLFVALVVPLTALLALPAPGGQNPFYYFFIYVAGFLACMQPDFADMAAKRRLQALAILLITVPAWLWMRHHFRDAAAFSAMDIFLALLQTFNVWLTLIVILGYGSKLRNVRHPWLDYANEAAFPIYVIHQTVIVAVGYVVVPLEWNLYVKYGAILIVSFAASCFLYEGVIRRVAVLRRLFGVKTLTPYASLLIVRPHLGSGRKVRENVCVVRIFLPPSDVYEV